MWMLVVGLGCAGAGEEVPRAVDVKASTDFTCALLINGDVSCWGIDDDWLADIAPPHGSFVDLGVGFRQVCALRDEGGIQCWGSDEVEGQDFEGILDAPSGEFVSIDTNAGLGCALDATGAATCWGWEDVPSPPEGVRFASLSTGSDFACGIDLDDSTIQCFCVADGCDVVGAPEGEFTSVSAGGCHACALDADGHATCWGDATLPDPPDDVAFRWISAGVGYTCGVTRAGEIECWGQEEGEGGTSAGEHHDDPCWIEDIPDAIQGSGFIAVSASDFHAAAIRDDGSVVEFGDVTWNNPWTWQDE